jgi:signal transduction histidine kinase
MSTNKPAKSTQSHEAWNLASALRDCFVCGTIHVEGEKVGLITSEAAQILGLSGNQVLEPSLEMFPQGLREIIQEVRHSGEPVAKRQLDVTIAGRRHFHLCVSALPLRRDAKHTSLIVTVNDLTSAKRLSQTLGRLDRLANLGTLSASMAHEIRNALVAGKTFIDLLVEKNKEDELTEVVQREIGRIDAIVRGMLKFAGSGRASFRKLRLHDALGNSLNLIQAQLTSRSITLKKAFDAGPDWMNGNENELQQAFVNLLLNAIEAMSSTGTLTVRTDLVSAGELRDQEEDAKNAIRVRIQDTGSGIASAEIKKLFEPFFTTKANGTGLGLAITKRIIQEHHGEIRVESVPGEGTTFSILLPALTSAIDPVKGKSSGSLPAKPKSVIPKS